MQVVLLEYGVEGASGSLTVDFSGLPGPGCAPLDGCTTAGSIGYSVGRTAASFLVFGRRRVRDGGGGLGFALLALRQGRMHAQVEAVSDATDGSQPGGTTSARVTLPDGTACTDSVSPPAPAFEAARSRGGALRVTLGPVDEPGIDAIRTRCPGPAQVDVSGGGALAAGAFDPHALGHPAIDLPLRTGGAFSAPGYAGSRSGEVVLHLRLRRARAVVVRLPASREGVPGL